MITILDLNNGINSVASGQDTGFLDCATQFLGATSRHSHNVGAISNIVSSAKPYLRAGIWGHGSPGIILTFGQTQGSADQYFSVNNQAVWRRQIAGLRKQINMLSLIGCYTGAGTAGFSLLRTFADAIDLPVSAPTANVICGIYSDGSRRVWIDPIGTWQTAFPGRSSPIIEAPSFTVFRTGNQVMVLKTISLTPSTTLNISDIIKIDIKYAPTDQTTPIFRTLSQGSDIKEFLQFVDLDNPISITGCFAQIITGSVTIEYQAGANTKKAVYDIYGDDKLVIPNTSTTFYRLDRLFHSYAIGTI